jgi:hypothetical protein
MSPAEGVVTFSGEAEVQLCVFAFYSVIAVEDAVAAPLADWRAFVTHVDTASRRLIVLG